MDLDKLRFDPSKKASEQKGFSEIRFSEDFIESFIEVYEDEGGTAAEAMLLSYVKEIMDDRNMKTIIEVLLFIIDSKSPRYNADALALASGLRVRDGWTPATLAKKYGVSRTTACVDVEKACDHFGLPKEIALRGSTEANSSSNQRNHVRKIKDGK